MSSHPFPASVRLDAGELVEAAFEIFVEAVRDFERLVLRMVCGQLTAACLPLP